MSSTTPNLGLFKYDTTTDAKVAFSITNALNNNWDIIDEKCGSGNSLLDFKWSDHLLNDMSWLRADTFSWQDGTTYSLAYNELLSEYNNSASVEETEGEITFKRTPKGYKIALATQETAILNKYNTDGIAWFYILDTTNKKFKLPRTKFGFEGLRTNVAEDITESLPNITGGFSENTASGVQNIASDQTYGAFTAKDNSTRTGVLNVQSIPQTYDRGSFYMDASRSSSTYQDNAPVQERATQMYLYFYVGGFTKSAESQTAGLKAELLNGKVDTSNTQWATNACMPDYSAGINIAVPTSSSNAFVAQYDCYMQGISKKVYYAEFYAYINGTQYQIGVGNGTNDFQSNNIYLFLPKGTTIYFTSGYVEASSLYVFPLKGVN